MGIVQNTDQAMLEHDKLDHVGRWLITFGQLFTQIGTRIVQSRNELLSEALQDQADRFDSALHEAYRAGRRDQRDGLPDPSDEDQADEHQGQGDGMVWTINEDELRAP